MVGVPGLADGDLLVRLLEHERDFRVSVDVGEKAIHVDRAEAPGERDLLLRGDVLVAYRDHGVVNEGLVKVVELSGVRDVCSDDFGTDAAGERFDLHKTVSGYRIALG